MAKPDLRRRLALACVVVLLVLLVLLLGGRALGKLLNTDDALVFDLQVARWMGSNLSAGHAWRTLVLDAGVGRGARPR